MKINLTLFALCSFTLLFLEVTAQNVTVSDPIFKNYLINNLAINTNNDSEIQVSEAENFTGTIDCSNLGITDLTGIEAFISLSNLTCYNNAITSLDVSTIPTLIQLSCRDNDLTSLLLGDKPQLTHLFCDYNNLTSFNIDDSPALSFLDCNNNVLTSLNTSNNISLTNVNCHFNQLTSIDVSTNDLITWLNVANNQLTAIDVTNNALLDRLYCSNNQLSSIDVSQNSNLKWLYCSNNQLASIEVETCTLLENFNCSNNQITALNTNGLAHLYLLDCKENQITTLDLSSNPALTQIYCNNNNLSRLNAANGNNSNFLTFTTYSNNHLACIQIDDLAYSVNNWANLAAFSKPENASWSEDCDSLYCVVTIPDVNFKTALLNNPSLNTNGDNEIQCTEATAYTGAIYCSAGNIQSIEGIEAFVNTTELHCDDNPISTIVLTLNEKLILLNCSNTLITELDLHENQELIGLYSTDNTNLSTLNIANGNNTNFEYLYLSNSTNLHCVKVDDGQYSYANWVGSNFVYDQGLGFDENCFLNIEGLNDSKLMIYPNPVSEQLIVTSETDENYTILNVFGQEVKKGLIYSKKVKNNLIDVRDFENGIYYIKIDTGVILKFIKF